MANRCLEGVNGSGKSMEGIKGHVLPALKAGRQVWCSIAGLNYAEFAKYLNWSEDQVRALLHTFTAEHMLQPGFFPQVVEDEHGNVEKVLDGVVASNSLVVADEVWKVWNKELKVPPEHLNFWAMQRHVGCDLIYLTQNFSRIHPELKVRTELRYKCRKLTALGFSKAYQVLFYEEGDRTSTHRETHKYDKAIFPLYKSHAVGGVAETSEKRANALGGMLFKFWLPLGLVAIAVGTWYVFHWLHTMGGAPAPTPAPVAGSSPVANSNPAPPGKPGAVGAAPAGTAPEDGWRVVASYQVGNFPVFLLTDSKGRYRTLTAGAFSRGASNDVTVTLPPDEGKDKATPYTGPAPLTGARSPGGSK